MPSRVTWKAATAIRGVSDRAGRSPARAGSGGLLDAGCRITRAASRGSSELVWLSSRLLQGRAVGRLAARRLGWGPARGELTNNPARSSCSAPIRSDGRLASGGGPPPPLPPRPPPPPRGPVLDAPANIAS